MALLEATLAMIFAGQQCICRWNYVSSGTPAAVSRSFGLAAAMGAIYDLIAVPPGYPTGTFMQLLAACISTGVTFEQLTVLNVYDVTDFYQTPFVNPYTGERTGESMSPALAYGWRSTQVRRDVARATKRLPGVSEAQVGTEGIVVAGQLTIMNAFADIMSDALTYDDEGNTLTYTPAVVKKQRYNPSTRLADPAGTAYRYIPVGAGAEAAQLAQTAVGIAWQSYNAVRTQVSRQYGHGR
jgi:hypothetical protein